MDSITIRPTRAEDYEAWLRLYHGYADHYQVSLSEAGIATTWGWLMMRRTPHRVCCRNRNRPAGLAHIRVCRAAAWLRSVS